jgi:hypothetical protein
MENFSELQETLERIVRERDQAVQLLKEAGPFVGWSSCPPSLMARIDTFLASLELNPSPTPEAADED